MAKAGDSFDSRRGDRLVFLQTAAETNGELVEVEVYFQPQTKGPPPHFHVAQTELFEIKSGTWRVTLDGETRDYAAGDVIIVPPNQQHTMFNAGDETVHVRWETKPAMRTELFFETLWGLAQDGKTDETGAPNLLQSVLIAQYFAPEFRVAEPHPALQRLLIPILAPIARALGYRARYERYSGPA